MKNLLKLEELALSGLCVYGLYTLDVQWWYYLILLFGPDIAMLGYVAGNKVGAAAYNLFHHKGLAVALFAIGWTTNNTTLQIAGIILFGHSSMDRMFGYGLKLKEGFKYTHLGMIGKKNN